jgi:hypothetical protein
MGQIERDAYRAVTEHFGLKHPQRTQLDTSPQYLAILLAAAGNDWADARSLLERAGIIAPGAVLGSDRHLHAVRAGYDGPGYGWDCTCGGGETDAPDLDTANIWGTLHLLAVDAVVSA